MRRWVQAGVLAGLVILGGSIAPPAHAEWTPPKHGQVVRWGHCPSGYWLSHKSTPCGWGTVPSLIHRVFRSTHGPRAYCVAKSESGLRPWAKNPHSSASGLFQLIGIHWRGKFNPFNPVLNTLKAYSLSHGGTNWAPWNWKCG